MAERQFVQKPTKLCMYLKGVCIVSISVVDDCADKNRKRDWNWFSPRLLVRLKVAAVKILFVCCRFSFHRVPCNVYSSQAYYKFDAEYADLMSCGINRIKSNDYVMHKSVLNQEARFQLSAKKQGGWLMT